MSYTNSEVYHVVKAIDDLHLNDQFLALPLLKSYTFWNHENKYRIMNHQEVKNDFHSSSSFSQVLKHVHKHYFFLK